MGDSVFTVHKSANEVNSLASSVIGIENLEEELETLDCRLYRV